MFGDAPHGENVIVECSWGRALWGKRDCGVFGDAPYGEYVIVECSWGAPCGEYVIVE